MGSSGFTVMVKLLLLFEDVDSDEDEIVECVELFCVVIGLEVSLLLDDDTPSSTPLLLVEWKTRLPTVFIAIDHEVIFMMYSL